MQVLNDETFAILVLMALFTTFITTPTLIAIYKPARSPLPYYNRNLSSISTAAANDDHDKPAGHDQLRIMACLHGLSNVPAVINLVDTITGGRNRSPLKLYIMHLVQLTERSSSIVMALRFRRDGLPHRTSHRRLRREVAIAFDAYGQLTAGRVAVHALTAVSALPTMHQDICDVAEGKRVAMVILPFHKRLGSGEGDMENVGPGWRAVAQRVLRTTPCSVGVLVDRGLGWTAAGGGRRVCVMFFGGPDDREAMEVAGRMAEHPGVAVTVVRFVNEKGSDNNSVRLRPSPGKCSEKSYSFSTAVVDRRQEEVRYCL